MYKNSDMSLRKVFDPFATLLQNFKAIPNASPSQIFETEPKPLLQKIAVSSQTLILI